MLEFLLSAVLLAPIPLDDEKKITPPSPAVVEATVDRLEAAYKGKDVDEILAALLAAKQVLHKDVIKEVAKGLKKKEAEVQKGAIETLRWMKHPEAVEALHDCYKRNKTLMKVDELATAVIKAIGQHGDPSSLKILTDNPFEPAFFKATQARILGLGMIRTNESLEATFAMMNKAGTGGRRSSGNRFIGEFRKTLIVLTGVDQGPRRDGWVTWWNNNKKTFEVSEEMPEIPAKVRVEWYRYWELKDETKKKKEEDGKRGRGRGGDAGGGDGRGGDGD